MNNSDSEEFESADEGFEPKAKTAEGKSSTSKKTTKVVRDHSHSEMKLPTDPTSENKDKQHITDEVIEEKRIPEGVDTNSATVESLANVDGNDGWDVDDWGDENIEENIEQLRKDIVSKNTLTINASADLFPVISSLDESPRSQQSPPPKSHVNTDTTIKSPNFAHALDRLASNKETQPQSSGWGWGSFNSILSSATEGVASITSHVSQGLSSVIGVPEPEQLARMQHEQSDQQKQTSRRLNEAPEEAGNPKDMSQSTSQTETDETKDNSEDSAISLGRTLVGGVTKIGNQVIMGGLDTLEGIGKKTMTILQENDPGLLKRRPAQNSGDNSSGLDLGRILREAKDKSELSTPSSDSSSRSRQKQLHFETLFDDYYGIVHFEALQMLSTQSKLKLESLLAPLSGTALTQAEQLLNEINELCEVQEVDESDGSHTVETLETNLLAAAQSFNETFDFKDILRCWASILEWLSQEEHTPQEIHDKALHSLAETAALVMCRFHKLAELILIKDHHSTSSEADTVGCLTDSFRWHLSGIAARFAEQLNAIPGDGSDNSQLITGIFLAENNASQYVVKCYQNFIPILQIGAI